MIAISHFADDAHDFLSRARTVLTALAAHPGYLRGTVGRSTDDPAAWVLITEWENVGAYRRALGGFDVKLQATPLLATAQDLPGAFEALVDVSPGGAVVIRSSDLESSQ